MKSKTPLIRPLNKNDKWWFTHHDKTVRGVVVELDGEIIGVAGVLHTSPLQAFSEMSDKIRKYPKTVMKVMLSFKKVLEHYDLPMYAIANEDEHNSRKVLERIGFKPLDGRMYKWQQQYHT